MSSIIPSVFKVGIGLLVNKGKAPERLKDGEPTEQNFRDSIMYELDDIKSKLDAPEARDDLRTSFSCFNEGLVCLFQLFDKLQSGGVSSVTSQAGAVMEPSSTTTATANVAEGMKKLKLTDLDDAHKRALLDALEGFKAASLKATKAFNNEALSTSDRLQAMVLRVAATILERVYFPEEALEACRLYLEELHFMPAVQNSFKVELKKGRPEDTSTADERREITATVCHVNRVIYDVTVMVGRRVELLSWPCVYNGKEAIDPLRDIRVTKEHYYVTSWSFGQEGEEGYKLKRPQGIATNAYGEFIVGDNEDCNVKVFDSKGKFVKSFSPSTDDTNVNLDIQNVAADRSNNIYVLIRREMPRGEMYAVYTSEGSSDLHCKFALRERFKAWNLTINDNNKVLVLGRRSGNEQVEVYQPDGQFVASFGDGRIKHAEGITSASEGRVVIVGTYFSYVHVFNEQGEHLFKFSLKVERYYLSLDVAFHWPTERILVAGKEEAKENLRVLVYTKDGKFEREIQHDGKWVSYLAGITVTMEGRTAAVVHSKMPGVLCKVAVF